MDTTKFLFTRRFIRNFLYKTALILTTFILASSSIIANSLIINAVDTNTSTNTIQNIALNANASASAYEISTNSTPNNAVDGDMSTRFAAGEMKPNGAVSADHQQTPQWLQLDLGKNSKVQSIEIFFHLKVYSTDYTILTSDTGEENSWSEMYHSTNLVASDTTRNPQDTITFESNQNFKRYVRFMFNKVNHFAGGNAVSIKEIKINGYFNHSKSNNTNIALNRPGESSGVEEDTATSPNDAFDNNPNTRFAAKKMKNNGVVSADSAQTPQWLSVDLGNDASIQSIELDFYRRVYSTDYIIQTSNNKVDWEDIYHSTNLSDNETNTDLRDTISFTNPINVKRYVRFYFNKVNRFAAGTAVSIKDIRINGTLLGEIIAPINPNEKLNQATLAINNNNVVLENIEDDAEYQYEIIGSSNQYVVNNNGLISPYRLNDKEITFVVAARNKVSGEIVSTSKQNKSILIPANHHEIVSGTNQKPKAAVEIQEFLAGEGLLQLQHDDSINVAPEYRAYVDLFNDDLQTILGFKLNINEQADSKITFKLSENDEYNLKDEGYLIKVTDKIEVIAHHPKAFNFAAVTLAQLLQAHQAIPKGIYRDYPSYTIRGMVLDVARIPMRIDFIKKIASLFRWYKLNELHLHLNDTQWPANGNRSDVDAWKKTEATHRLESTTFPSLNQNQFKHDRYENEFEFYRNTYQNPTYSLEEFNILQSETNLKGINILAEIDTPGHSAAYSLYALENPDNIDYLGQPIHHPNDLEALSINEQLYPDQTRRAKRFVKALLGEYLDNQVFSYDHIHLGVDEYWQKNGNIESFRQYLNELNEYAQSKGKTVRTWGALTMFNGSTPVSKDIIFDEWSQGESLSVDRINEGYKIVNVPQPFTYITPGRHHKDSINEQYVFDHWKPHIFNLNIAQNKQAALVGEPLLLGAKGAMWGDEHAEGIEESDLYERLEKSLAMIGFKTWNPDTNRSYIDYQKTMNTLKLNNNYLPLETSNDITVEINAEHTLNSNIIDISNNQHQFNTHQLNVVEMNGEKWFDLNGTNHITTDIDTIRLPYTLEMTFIPKNVDEGSLLSSNDGAIFLNKKARKQDGSIETGLMFNRYFYSQFIQPKLEANKEYKLTLSATRQVLNVFINGEKVATFAHQNETSHTGSESNFRTSFNLPFKEIGKGFNGYIKNIKVYNRTASSEEIENDHLNKINVALHKPVYDFRHNSDFFNQGIRPYNRTKITDGDIDANEGRWNSSDNDYDYFIIDLEKPVNFSEFQIEFDAERFANGFKILTSNDMENFTEIYSTNNNNQAIVNHQFAEITARYVKFELTKRQNGKNETGVKEFRIFQSLATQEKESLATAFKRKKVNLSNEDWLTVNNIISNKYATQSAVNEAYLLLNSLEDKPIGMSGSGVVQEKPQLNIGISGNGLVQEKPQLNIGISGNELIQEKPSLNVSNNDNQSKIEIHKQQKETLPSTGEHSSIVYGIILLLFSLLSIYKINKQK